MLLAAEAPMKLAGLAQHVIVGLLAVSQALPLEGFPADLAEVQAALMELTIN